jgi:biotin synthase
MILSINLNYHPSAEDVRARNGRQLALHERALAETRARFGRKVFVRGVVEVSNYCRQNCHYCGMRRDNRSLDRARAETDRIADLLINHRPQSITDLNIQAGEDPVAVREVVLPLLRILRRETSLGLSVCLGTLHYPLYEELKAAGASVYVIKFETADPHDYRQWQAPGNLDERLHHIRWLAASGWVVSSGFIAGFPGDTEADLLLNCQCAASLPLRGCSVSPFVPGEQTPLGDACAGDVELTLNCMAILRLMRNDWIIPAVSALNSGSTTGGYQRGLRAGANLVTINLTPRDLQEDYVIYKRDRFIMNEERVLRAIDAEGLTVSGEPLQNLFGTRSADPESAERALQPN